MAPECCWRAVPVARWSNPAFYALGSASFGLQAGLEQSEAILLVMTQRGVNALLHDQFKIGAQAGIAVATLGSGVEGAVNPGGADIVVWSSSSGVYGGLALDGSIIRPQPEDNARYYGRPLTTSDILFRHIGVAPRANALRTASWQLSGKIAGVLGAWYCRVPRRRLGDSLAVELPALDRAALVRIQVP